MLASSSSNIGVAAKLADFGLAALLGSDDILRDDTLTSSSGPCFRGTFTHMGPEKLEHGTVDRAGDIYAFGITMWQLYTGWMALLFGLALCPPQLQN
jgi:serine/threonine protein kinase